MPKNRGFDKSYAATALASVSFVLVCGTASASVSSFDQVTTNTGASPTLDSPASTAETTAAAMPAPSSTTSPGATAPSPTTTAPAIPAGKVPFRGVNISGAEWGAGVIPGAFGKEYVFPTNAEFDYYLKKGMNTFRIPFLWERLQPKANSDFDATYLGRLDAVVSYATSKGAHVIIDPHNYARYYGKTIGSPEVPNEVFGDLWTRLATKYASNPLVIFNLVNEPHDLPTEQWASAAQAGIDAIRATGATNTILVPGNGWTGAHSWNSDTGGASNAVAMLKVTDTADNMLFEVHQYLDGNSSGTSDTCVSSTIGRERMAGFVKWLRDNGKKGFVGEFAGGNNSTCNAAVTDMLNSVMESSDVLTGFTWWGSSPWWSNYMFTLDPTSSGQDRPQWALLSPFLPAP